MTVKEALINTKPGIPYKFFDLATVSDITQKVVFDLSHYSNSKIVKAIMTDSKIYYYI